MPEEIFNIVIPTAEAEAGIARLIALIEEAQAKVIRLSNTPITTAGAGGEQVPTQFAQFKESLANFQQDATRYQSIIQQISAQGGQATPAQAQQFATVSASITEATQKLQGYVSLSREQLAQPATPVVPQAPVTPPVQPVTATVTQTTEQQVQADSRLAQQTTSTTTALEQEVVAEQQVAQGALQAAQAKDQLAQAEQRVAVSAQATPQRAETTPPVTPVTPVVPTEPQTIPVTADTTVAKAEVEAFKETASRPIPPQAITADATQLKQVEDEIAKADALLQQVGTKPVSIPVDDAQVKQAQADLQALEQQTQKRLSTQPVAPVAQPVTPVTQPTPATATQTETATASLQQEATAEQQVAQSAEQLNAVKAQLAQAEQNLAQATTGATTALQQEAIALQELVAMFGQASTAANQLLLAQRQLGQTGQVVKPPPAPTPAPIYPTPPQTPIVEPTAPTPVLETQPIQSTMRMAASEIPVYTKNLGDLRQAMTAAQNAFDGSAASIEKVIFTTRAYDAALQDLKKVEAVAKAPAGFDVTKTESDLQRLMALQKQAQAQASELKATGTPIQVGEFAKGFKETEFANLNKDIEQINASLPKAQMMMAQVGQGKLPTDQWQKLNTFIEESTAKLQRYSQLSTEAFAQPRGYKPTEEAVKPTVEQKPIVEVPPVKEAVVRVSAEDSALKLKFLEIDAKKAQYEAQGIKVNLYTQMKGTGLTEPEIQAGFAGMNLPAEEYTKAATAAKELEQIQQRLASTPPPVAPVTPQQPTQPIPLPPVDALKGYRDIVPDLTAQLEQQAATMGGKIVPETVRYGTSLNQVTGQLKQTLSATAQLADGQKAHISAMSGATDQSRQLTNVLEHQFTRIVVGLAIWTTFRAVTNVINEQITALREYEMETARFAAITGQSLGEARQQWDQLAQVAGQAGVTPMGAAQTVRIAVQMEGTDETREAFVRTVTQLEELTGVSSDRISKSISSALRQAGKGLEEAPRIGDLIASSLQRIPASKLEDVVAALQEAPALARLWGTSFEEAFSIIVEGAARVQESPEQIATAFQRLSQGLNEIAQGGEKAFERTQVLKDFGVNIEDANGKLRKTPEILRDVYNAMQGLSPARQQTLIEAVVGGSVRPEQMRNITGGLEAFNVDLSTVIDKLDGTLQKMIEVVDQNLGQVVKVMDARIAQLREKGDLISNLLVSAVRGTVGQYGGKQGAEVTTNLTEAALAGTTGEGQKQDFIKDIVNRAGGDPVKIQQYTKEHNDAVQAALTKARQDMGEFWFGAFQGGAAEAYAQGLTISDQDVANTLKAGGDLIGQAAQERAASLEQAKAALSNIKLQPLLADVQSFNLKSLIGDALKQLSVPQQAVDVKVPVTVTPTQTAQTPQQLLAEKAKTVTFTQEGQLRDTSFFTKAPEVDATKYTQDQINRAKAISLQLSQQELEAIRAQAAALGFNVTQIDAIIAKRKEELETQMVLLKTSQGMNFEIGFDPNTLQEGFRQIDEQIRRAKQAQKEAEKSFQFQKTDITSAQFPQLQAMAAAYDALLSKLGSPEKQQNVNLLLGDDTFKTMNVRLSALQMAMEELNKTEKAQLSGTWNLPSGATALVPIQSLDIQRWNKGEGGGIEATTAAIQALADSMKQQPTVGGKDTSEGGGYYYPRQQKPQQITGQGITPTDLMTQPPSARPHPGLPLGTREATESLTQTFGLFNQILLQNMPRVGGGLRGAPAVGGGAGIPQPPARAGAEGFRRQEPIVMPFTETNRILTAILGAIQTPRREQVPTVTPRREDTPRQAQPQQDAVGRVGTEVSSAVTRLGQVLSAMWSQRRDYPDAGVRQQQLRPQEVTQAARAATPPVIRNEVNVSMLPLKANFNANLNVNLNGYTVARAIFPILYQMMTRAARSSSAGVNNLGQVR